MAFSKSIFRYSASDLKAASIKIDCGDGEYLIEGSHFLYFT